MSGTNHLFTATGRRIPSPPRRPPPRTSSILRVPTYRYDPERQERVQYFKANRDFPQNRSQDPSQIIPPEQRRNSQVVLYRDPTGTKEGQQTSMSFNIETRTSEPSVATSPLSQSRNSSPCLNRDELLGRQSQPTTATASTTTTARKRRSAGKLTKRNLKDHVSNGTYPESLSTDALQSSQRSSASAAKISSTAKKKQAKSQAQREYEVESSGKHTSIASASTLENRKPHSHQPSSRASQRSAPQRPSESSYRPEMPLVAAARHYKESPPPRYSSRSARSHATENEDQVALPVRVRGYSTSADRNDGCPSAAVVGTEILPAFPYLQGQRKFNDGDRHYRTIIWFIQRQPESQRPELERMLNEFNGREEELCEALTEAYGEDFEILKSTASIGAPQYYIEADQKVPSQQLIADHSRTPLSRNLQSAKSSEQHRRFDDSYELDHDDYDDGSMLTPAVPHHI